MLKTQFAKVFYLCNSLLFTSVPLTNNPDHNSTKYITTAIPASSEFNLSNKSAQSNFRKPQITMNRREMLFTRNYIKNSSQNLSSIKKRSSIPFSIIDSVFRKYGLPVELKYLAVIESELKPTAVSHVGARGPWQMMPETAHVLGLKTSGQCDERTNYYKSTIAAAKYLRDLYAQFNDWLLVLAAYNGGPKPVLTAIRESGSKNFWVLQDHLPAESREHVKKFIATHYYFEGNGSETTLTSAENKKFRKMVDAFIKSHNIPAISNSKGVTIANSFSSAPDQTFYNDTKFPIGFDLYETGNGLYANQNTALQYESSETKFKRLMKESEETLKKSVKVM